MELERMVITVMRLKFSIIKYYFKFSIREQLNQGLL